MNKPFISRPTICPKCGGKIVEIIYGEPSIELFEAHERGEIILGEKRRIFLLFLSYEGARTCLYM